MNNEQSSFSSSERNMNQEFWDELYISNDTGWDLGEVSPPIKSYIDDLGDKNISILIPGCGNSHEAEYLLQQGFTNITVIDIAPTLVENLQKKFKNTPSIKIVLGDFFEHQGKYDLIIEHTFFCALPPVMREKYVSKMHQILADSGKLAGLLFNKTFEGGPPFGGSKAEYQELFKDYFEFRKLDLCLNSIPKRADSELFIEFQKKEIQDKS